MLSDMCATICASHWPLVLLRKEWELEE